MADVAYLVTDLLFVSKIRETATQLGLVAAGARDAAALATAAVGARVVLLDLRLAAAPAALDALRAAAATRDIPAIGFVEHERVVELRGLAERNCRVLTKGKFSSELPALLAGAAPRG